MPIDPPLPFQPFYVAHRAAVLRLLAGMVGPADAEDCFQETWLKVLRSWPPTNPAGRLDSWVLTIAHRAALDLLRRTGRELATDELLESPAGAAEPVELLELGPTDLHEAVAALPDRRRAAVLLRVVLDQSHAQVAEVLGCSEDAARRAYADGLAQLRRTMEVGR